MAKVVSLEANDDISGAMTKLGAQANQASRSIALVGSEQKNRSLCAMAEHLRSSTDIILKANAKDMEFGTNNGLSDAMLDRLFLSKERIEAMAEGLEVIAQLPEPVGRTLAQWTRPNGLHISRVSTPIGVIGVIYESRPNVTADAAGLCMKSGNAVILRCGSDSQHSSTAICNALRNGLEDQSLPKNIIQMVPSTDRACVGEMLKGLNGNLDVIIPRGGKSLVARVQDEARIPIFAHLEGLCHLYVDKSARIDMAVDLVENAKMRRTGICGAAETLLVDQACVKTHLPPIIERLQRAGCELHMDVGISQFAPDEKTATDEDWTTEYLAPVLAIKAVNGIDGAIDHISKYSSNHTEAIIAEDDTAVQRFNSEVDSAILLHNASTQFADGAEFGMGAEIGIATGKMHARGPVGVEQLTSFKYLVSGNGQCRP